MGCHSRAAQRKALVSVIGFGLLPPAAPIELAPTLKGGAAHRVVGKLLSEALIEEILARGALPVWRRDDEQGAVALRITPRGLAAIQVEDGGAQATAEERRA